jgi:hypothetical protein
MQQPPLDPNKVNVVFTWSFNGNTVELIGSFSSWDTRLSMTKTGNEFTLVVPLDRGIH